MSQGIRFLDELKHELIAHASRETQQVPAPRWPHFRPRGAWVGLAVFIAVLLVGGTTLILSSGSTPSADRALTATDWDVKVVLLVPDEVDRLVETIESVPGVLEARYFPDAINLPEAALPGDVDLAAVLVRLRDPSSAEQVANTINGGVNEVLSIIYSDEIAKSEADAYFDFAASQATILDQDPLILQPSPGPAPQFDASDLGTGVTLTPAQSASEIPNNFLTQAKAPSVGTYVLNPDRPVIHVGHLEEGDIHLMVYGTESDGYCVWVANGDTTGRTCGDFNRYPFGVVMWGSGYPVGDVTVRVPSETSVVTLTVDSGETLWQTPRAGWALFPVTGAQPTLFTTTAYDAEGAQIGTWKQTG